MQPQGKAEDGAAPAAEGYFSRPYRKLTPGPKYSADWVAADQRFRLQRAVVELTAERGYERIAVRDLVGRARVSTASLYSQFSGKQECFLSAYDVFVRCAAQEMLLAARSGEGWRERLRLAVEAAVAACLREPRLARFVLVDSFSAWPLPRERRRHAAGLFEAVIADSVSLAVGSGVKPPPLLARAVAAGVVSAIRGCLAPDRNRCRGELALDLAAWAEALVGGGTAELVEPHELGGATRPLRIASGLGRHDDRSLLLAAVTRLAGSEGYGSLSVARIRATAGLSRQAFCSEFESVDGCFLAALEHYGEELVDVSVSAGGSGGDWREAVGASVAALCGALSDGRLARALLVESLMLGTTGLSCRTQWVASLAAGLRGSVPACRRPGPTAAEASVGAVWALLEERAASGLSACAADFVAALVRAVAASCPGGPSR